MKVRYRSDAFPGGAFRCLAGILAALAMALAAGELPASDRQGISAEEQSDWSAIGRVNVQGVGFCTGTLIAPDLVLTAGHCLFDRRFGRVVRPSLVHFLAGFRAGSFAHHGRAAAVALADDAPTRKVDLRRDLGLIRLTEPVPPGVAPLSIAPAPQAGTALFTLSFGMDRAQILSRQGGCRILGRDGPLFVTDCEGIDGVSGAPLLTSGPDHPALAGVAVAVPARAAPGARKGLVALHPAPGILQRLQRLVGGSPGVPRIAD